jgi:V/A-type H+-transporting ATPase subunit E
MQNKLQELTDKLYNEGLSKGKEEGEAILAQAKTQAKEIVANAQKEAEAIVAKAHKDAEDLKAKVDGDLEMAANQSLQATKHEIETLIISKVADLQVSGALASADFFKEIIKTVAQKFSAEESKDIALILPESMKAELEPFVKNELSQVLGGSVEATFSKKIAGGFNIGPKDGSYFISLTDETFKSLISNYLRPTTRKFLFGE